MESPLTTAPRSLPSAFAKLVERGDVEWNKLWPFLLVLSRSGLCESLEGTLASWWQSRNITKVWRKWYRISTICSLQLYAPLSSRGDWFSCLKVRNPEHPGCIGFLWVNSGRDGYLQRDTHAICFGYLPPEEDLSHPGVPVSLHFLDGT